MSNGYERLRHMLLTRVEPLLEWIDVGLYLAVAVLFFFVAAIYGVYSVATFIDRMGDHNFTEVVIEAITNLLLVLIVLEVVGTIRSYITTGATSLKPFLYIGIISAVRRILEIGAESALKDPASATEAAFRHRVIELGIDGAVVLALALALYLFARQEKESPTPSQEEPNG